YLDLPRPLLIRLVVDGELQLAACRADEQLPVVVADLQVLVANGQYVVADVQLHPVLVHRSVAVDVRHLVEAGRVGGQFEAGEARLRLATAASSSAKARADTGVRCV